MPKGLLPLFEDGFIDEVLGQLQSGKEATVYVVAAADEVFCAKVYKNVLHRSFQRNDDYREGRKSRHGRGGRGRGRKGSYHNRVEDSEWKVAEAETLYRLVDAGVRVPEPYGVHHGVLLMELVVDEDGQPAPRLNEVTPDRELALEWHAFLMQQIVRMLCADVIHGDLSEYNILVGPDGPVIIDLPQAVSATGNNHALRFLARDVENAGAAFRRVAPELVAANYARELWYLYQSGDLQPDTVLTGIHEVKEPDADVEAVLEEIETTRLEAEARERARLEEWDE